MPVALNIDTREMKKLHRALDHIRDGVPKAVVPAVNRALSSGQTTIKREIRKIYLIKAKDIPTKLHRARYASPVGHIRIDQGMLGVDKFRYKPRAVQRRKNKRPLFVQIKRSGGGVVARSFVTSGKGGLFSAEVQRHVYQSES